jgi:hypothetical protein
MFDLNQQIAQWRQSLGQSESLVRSDLDELESHLRDQIEHLSASGLSAEEAFLVAQHRIGDAKNLPGEFAKVNGSAIFRRRLQWMLAGVLAYLLIFNLSHLASAGGTVVAYLAGFQGYALSVIGQCAGLAIAVVGLMLIAMALKSRSINRVVGSAVSGPVFGSIMVVGVIVLIAARIMIPALAARYLGVQDYGQVTFVQTIAGIAYSLLIPILAVIVLLLLRRQTVRSQATTA